MGTLPTLPNGLFTALLIFIVDHVWESADNNHRRQVPVTPWGPPDPEIKPVWNTNPEFSPDPEVTNIPCHHHHRILGVSNNPCWLSAKVNHQNAQRKQFLVDFFSHIGYPLRKLRYLLSCALLFFALLMALSSTLHSEEPIDIYWMRITSYILMISLR